MVEITNQKSNRMLIESKGIRADNFYIPPFELNQGEIVVLCLFGGQHFYETEMYH